NHPDIRIALSKLKVAEEQHKQASAGYLPKIDLTAGYGYEHTDSPATRRGYNAKTASGTGDQSGTAGLKRGELGFSLRQMIFDGFYTSSELSRTEHEASAEQLSLLATAEDLALSVAKVYTEVLLSEEVLSLSKKNLESHIEIYDQIKERTESGLGSVADLSQVSGRLARANVNVIAATNNYRDVMAQFLKLVNQRADSLIIPVPDVDLLPKSMDGGLKNALANHPVIKSAGNDIKAARYAKETTKSNFYPTLTFELDANANNNVGGEEGIDRLQSDIGGHNTNASAMIRFRYNIYAGGKNSSQTRAAAYRISEAIDINLRAHREVTEGYALSWNAYDLLGQQMKFIQQHVEASKETQRSYKQQFRLGQRSLLDLLDTENELFEARKDYLVANFKEISAKYRLLNATGMLLDSMRVTRSSLWLGDDKYEGGTR
ncbi:MAG: TolC family outer membrane protein, partial [Psychrobium sp.]|nr:TolC family outer membrane protein [Psychrobium sp.]